MVELLISSEVKVELADMSILNSCLKKFCPSRFSFTTAASFKKLLLPSLSILLIIVIGSKVSVSLDMYALALSSLNVLILLVLTVDMVLIPVYPLTEEEVNLNSGLYTTETKSFKSFVSFIIDNYLTLLINNPVLL